MARSATLLPSSCVVLATAPLSPTQPHSDRTSPLPSLARAPADVRPEAGDEVGVVFEEEHVHLFDAETGEDVFLTDEEVEAAVA